MNWILVAEIIYVITVIAVCARVVYFTNHPTKTLGYLLLIIFVPIIGIIFYFSFGLNYRKNELYSKKLINDDSLWQQVRAEICASSDRILQSLDEKSRPDLQLVRYLTSELSPLTSGNTAKLLVNGEDKFPEVIKAIEEAKEHIHIEYYIYENDLIGREIADLLIKKAKEGVKVRFIYDDFGARGIRKNIARKLRAETVEAYPFYEIVFIRLANRLNYRNHRKIIVVDGKKAFVGGINISDRYVNNGKYAAKNDCFWRDTHLMIEGPGVQHLQYIFICDWNFCTGSQLENVFSYFPFFTGAEGYGNKLIQIAASGPDSSSPTILYSLLYAIHGAEKEVLITTPYFIPEESIMDAIMVAALGGVTIRMLVPFESDSKIVQFAACSYFEQLLDAGVQLYFYKKGFVHAKTIVVDKKVAIIGTANMDIRSFDLNFEVNAIIYDKEIANNLATIFENDLKDAELVNKIQWSQRSFSRKFLEKTARLVSPLL